MIIDKTYIKHLFELKFPSCCKDWIGSNSNMSNEYGELLKKFNSNRNSFDDQIDFARMISIKLEEKYTDEELKIFVETYNQIKKKRDDLIDSSDGCCSFMCGLKEVSMLSEDNNEAWGSKKQYLSGYVCKHIFKNYGINLPVFLFCLLNPTGGITGPQNIVFCNKSTDYPITVHSAIHDACGYCYNYHNMGPGYNYIGTCFALCTSSPMSCQIMGIKTCQEIASSVELARTVA
jgi:hypothetical protein